jgi:hypothetical protein
MSIAEAKFALSADTTPSEEVNPLIIQVVLEKGILEEYLYR